jgi:hypothetical protein
MAAPPENLAPENLAPFDVAMAIQSKLPAKSCVMPLALGGKKPYAGVHFAHYQPDRWTPEISSQRAKWPMGGCDYGILAHDDLFILDLDTKEIFATLPGVPADAVSESTRRGLHLYFLSTDHSRLAFPSYKNLTEHKIEVITVSSTGSPHILAVAPSKDKVWINSIFDYPLCDVPDELVDYLAGLLPALTKVASTKKRPAPHPNQPMHAFVEALGLRFTDGCNDDDTHAWVKFTPCYWCGKAEHNNNVQVFLTDNGNIGIKKLAGDCSQFQLAYPRLLRPDLIGGPAIVDGVRRFNPFNTNGVNMNEIPVEHWMKPAEAADYFGPTPWIDIGKLCFEPEEIKFYSEFIMDGGNGNGWSFAAPTRVCPLQCGVVHDSGYYRVFDGERLKCPGGDQRPIHTSVVDVSALTTAAAANDWDDTIRAFREIMTAAQGGKRYDHMDKYFFTEFGYDCSLYGMYMKGDGSTIRHGLKAPRGLNGGLVEVVHKITPAGALATPLRAPPERIEIELAWRRAV